MSFEDMEENSDQPKGSIKIVDRRRFDSEGLEKPEGSEQSVEQPVNKEPPANKEPADNKEPLRAAPDESETEPEGDEGDISFSSFVISMATQALMLMGQMKAPDGMPVPTDPAAAKQTIDILRMLEAKTRGNLNSQEEQLIKDALHNLKIAYLRFA